jgi:hypothetical protein
MIGILVTLVVGLIIWRVVSYKPKPEAFLAAPQAPRPPVALRPDQIAFQPGSAIEQRLLGCLAAYLPAGERIEMAGLVYTHTIDGVLRPRARHYHYYVGVTQARLLVAQVKVGALDLTGEIFSVQDVPLSTIRGVQMGSNMGVQTVTLHTPTGSPAYHLQQKILGMKELSTQAAFLQHFVPRLQQLTGQQAPQPVTGMASA